MLLDDNWGKKYPNITASWQTHRNELSTFFKYPETVRKLIYTTNPIESLNATIKRKTKSKGSFPQEQQEKCNANSIRNWYEIFPQLCIFFSEIMSKYTK